MKAETFSLRPEGFPLSEEEFREMKIDRMRQLVAGEFRDVFSEWLLRGNLGEPFEPTVALAIFPTPATTLTGFIHEPEEEIIGVVSRAIPDYWQETLSLSLPERVKILEKRNYKDLDERGGSILQLSVTELARNLLPTAMIVFNQPEGSTTESAYLFSPTIISPSAALEFFQNEARRYASPS